MKNRSIRFSLGLFICMISGVSVLAPTRLVLSQDTIPRALLVDIARSQFSVMCRSEAFTQCLGFSSQQCIDLSENAISQCLRSLPAEVNLDELKNDALESCPQGVFADAGFSEEKAGICFDQAMDEES